MIKVTTQSNIIVSNHIFIKNILSNGYFENIAELPLKKSAICSRKDIVLQH